MNIGRILRTLCLVLFLVMVGCASIPPEAPELSVELGKRISVIEDANITLLHRYFDEKRNDVDAFIQEEWVPIFAEEVFSNRKIAQIWDKIVSEHNKQDRLRFIVSTGPKLQARINRKRLELIKPLDDLERRIEDKIRTEYTQARAINNGITSFLISASKVTETRSRYLEMIGVKDKEIGNFIDKTDEAVSDLVRKKEGTQAAVDATKEYLKTIKAIMESI